MSNKCFQKKAAYDKEYFESVYLDTKEQMQLRDEIFQTLEMSLVEKFEVHIQSRNGISQTAKQAREGTLTWEQVCDQ